LKVIRTIFFAERGMLARSPYSFHVALLREVRATLGFRYGYLNAWELYSGQGQVERKSAANSMELKELE
jgi:hypothetical protein